MTELDVAVEAAHAAAAVIAGIGPLSVSHKSTFDLVTQADVASENAIREVLQKHTPDVPVLGEEGGGASQASTRWVVDPIDGTTNFVHGVPHYGISIALEVDGEPVVGVVHNPAREETFRAARGEGAWRDEQRLAVSGVRTLAEALCVTGFSTDRSRIALPLAYHEAVLRACQAMRRMGAASLDFCFVAAGHFDGYFELELNRWDCAAGILIVTEAGGRVTAMPGGELGDRPSPLATNGWLHDELFSLIEVTRRSQEGAT